MASLSKLLFVARCVSVMCRAGTDKLSCARKWNAEAHGTSPYTIAIKGCDLLHFETLRRKLAPEFLDSRKGKIE